MLLLGADFGLINDNQFLLVQIDRYGCGFHSVIISRKGDVNWPPKTCRFFLVGLFEVDTSLFLLQSTYALNPDLYQ